MDFESCKKNVMSLMVKTVFESDTSLRNYHEKMEEIRLGVCMSACVSMCQPTLGGTASSQKGFCASMN
jgi:hypothetical protein